VCQSQGAQDDLGFRKLAELSELSREI